MINNCVPNFTSMGGFSKILFGSYEMSHTLTDCCCYPNLSSVPHVLKVFKDGVQRLSQKVMCSLQ